jgi:hypothetical protein
MAIWCDTPWSRAVWVGWENCTVHLHRVLQPRRHHLRASAQEAASELFEPFVAGPFGLGEQLGDVSLEPRLAPVVARRAFRELGLVHTRRFEQRTSRRAVEGRIISFGKVIEAARHLAFRVVSQECL